MVRRPSALQIVTSTANAFEFFRKPPSTISPAMTDSSGGRAPLRVTTFENVMSAAWPIIAAPLASIGRMNITIAGL
ncbi:hypothetical protein J4558_18095 [Leptolyngbya sp. 15MV]|nr:hypothetical protein J4558_18095 [Leptolyngbya sp. 15MV]